MCILDRMLCPAPVAYKEGGQDGCLAPAVCVCPWLRPTTKGACIFVCVHTCTHIQHYKVSIKEIVQSPWYQMTLIHHCYCYVYVMRRSECCTSTAVWLSQQQLPLPDVAWPNVILGKAIACQVLTPMLQVNGTNVLYQIKFYFSGYQCLSQVSLQFSHMHNLTKLTQLFYKLKLKHTLKLMPNKIKLQCTHLILVISFYEAIVTNYSK